jgi:hypothetical protein
VLGSLAVIKDSAFREFEREETSPRLVRDSSDNVVQKKFNV